MRGHKVDAEWHFSATSHGKSACDGLGAIFKREAYKASLVAKPTNAILNSNALFKWSQIFYQELSVSLFNKVQHEKMRKKLSNRFSVAPA